MNEENISNKIEKLDGTNYKTWKFNCKLLLMSKSLWEIVDGSKEAPAATEDAKVKQNFKSKQNQAYSIIALSISKDIQIFITCTNDPKKAWDILENQFSFVSITQLVRVYRKFYASSMVEGGSIMEHVTKMTQLAQDLREMGKDITSQEFAVVILGSLPSSYDMFVTSLNARGADDLDWESIKGALTEESTKIAEKSISNTVNEAFLSHEGDGQGNQQRDQYRSFSRQNRPNVSRGNNFRRGGNFRNSDNNNRNMDGVQMNQFGKCFSCGGTGHLARYCANNNYRNNNRSHEHGRLVELTNMVADNLIIHDDLALASSTQNQSISVEYCKEIALAVSDETNNSEWFIDSAASKHMTFNKSAMSNYSLFDKSDAHNVALGDGYVVQAEGKGEVKLLVRSKDKVVKLTLHNVLYVPNLSKNLLSVNSITEKGAGVYFDNSKCTLVKDDKSYEIGHAYKGKLYRLNTNLEEASVAQSLWHQRMGHMNTSYVEKLSNGNIAKGVSYDEKDVNCKPCTLGKMKKQPFPISTSKTSRVLELIHSDLCGPIQVDSKGGSKYFLTFTDDYSRFSTVYFLHSKSQVLSYYKNYVALMENQSGQRLLKIRTDNGGEYTSKEFFEYCKAMGEARDFTNPYTPEQNGVSERLNQTLVNCARTMMIHAGLPVSFWAEAIQCATYVKNRSPTTALCGKTPYEMWYGKVPDLSHMKVFGCKAYAYVPPEQRNKFDNVSVECIFVGYPEGTKGYRLFNVSSGKFIRSRNVKFYETEFFEWKGEMITTNHTDIFCEKGFKYFELEPNLNSLDMNTAEDDQCKGTEIQPEILIEDTEEEVRPEIQVEETETEPVERNETYEDKFLRETENLGKRKIHRPAKYDDYECNISPLLEEPKSIEAALSNENWGEAIRSEMSSLMRNETWSLVPRPVNKNVVGSKWIFKLKRNPDGSIERYKARLVAQGFTQVHGIDYNEVFSPVVKFTSIRTLFAFANDNNYEIHHMDVKTAYLNGELDHEIYMEQPEGFVDPLNPSFVCKLKKSIYGLKQSARCWNSAIDNFLRKNGYTSFDADECIFLKEVDGKFVIHVIYVDDLIPISNDKSMLEAEKDKLMRQFDMVDKGEISFILGMQVKRDRERGLLSISQPAYLETMLKKFKMENCNPISTPMECGMNYHKIKDSENRCNTTVYQQAIGSLTYAAITTRPDIVASVNCLSQFMSAPSSEHWSGIKRIFRYLKGTIDFGLLFRSNCNVLVGYSDSDWAGNFDTRRSTSGYAFYVGESLVSWSSRKQCTVAKSTTEAEYVALSSASQEAIWLRRLLNDLHYHNNSATIIYEDNQGAIELSKNSKHHNRTKHIDIAFHFIRERIATKEIDVIYCPTDMMIADIMTKALPRPKYERFRELLGVGAV